MIIVALFLLPDWRCAMWIGLSVLSIETGVIGIFSLIGYNLDAISSGAMIICIGFSVDFSAHVSHSYISSKANSAEGRVREALGTVGIPILQGGISTFAGVALLVLVPSHAFRVFFVCISLVVLLGAIHGLIFLPVLLSVFIKPTPEVTMEVVVVNKMSVVGQKDLGQNFQIHHVTKRKSVDDLGNIVAAVRTRL
jgi:predicted RND superfamily exporter protein